MSNIKQIINELKSNFFIGPYKCNDPGCVKNVYNRNMILSEPISVPIVSVWNISSVETLSKILWDEKTHSLSNPNKLNPIIVMTVDNDYDGTDKEKLSAIHDLRLYASSNIFRVLENSQLFPIRHDCSLWVKNAFIIGLQNENFFRRNPIQSNFIIASLNKNPKKIRRYLRVKDFKSLNLTIETIFQTAIMGRCDTLILPDFLPSHDDSYVKMVTNIINYQITKYGYFFKYIFISVPTMSDQKKVNIYNAYKKYIITPQDFVRN